MASGSTAPFSGEFSELENVPKLPEGISAEQIFEQNSDVVRQVAEARHQAGLSQVEADGGFFDAFVDNSKIDTLTSIRQTTGSNGFLEMGLVGSGNIQTVSNNRSTLGFFDEFCTFTPSTESLVNSVTFTIARDYSSTTLRIKDSNDNVILERDFGSVTRNTQETATFAKSDYSETLKSGTTYIIELEESGGDNTVYKESVSKSGSVADFSRTPDNGSVTIEGVVKASSGKSTSTNFQFTDTQGNSFSPSKVGIFPDQTLNGQSISYDLKDSTGTVVKTFNQSDLNQLQSVNTTDTTFQVEANFSGNGSQTPELEFLDVRGV